MMTNLSLGFNIDHSFPLPPPNHRIPTKEDKPEPVIAEKEYMKPQDAYHHYLHHVYRGKVDVKQLPPG
jgi:hypothetical protein